MESQTLLQADYLDIIFDKRNKAYGGYELRKHYERRVKKAGFYALLGITAVFTFSFIAEHRKADGAILTMDKASVLTQIQIAPPPIAPPPPVVPPRATTPPPPPAPSKMFTPPVVTDEPIKPDEAMTRVSELKNINPGLSNTKGDSTSEGSIGSMGTGPGTVIPPLPTVSEPKLWVEQMPEFAGDLNSYLANHVTYPPQARSAGLEGTVGIKFVVNENGTISDVRVVRSLGADCDEEARKAIAGMPRWKPGKQNGIPVKVYFTQAITFKLQ